MSNEGLTLVRDRWYTALTADVTSAATSLPVVTNTVGGNVLPTPCIVMCGFEQMYATASTATTITVTRGFNSTAAAHAKGATVGQARVAAHHNDVVTSLAAIGGSVLKQCKVRHSTNQSIGDTTPTALAFDTEMWDTDAFHSTSSNTSRLTIPANGRYRVTGTCGFASNTTGYRALSIRLNAGLTMANAVPPVNGDDTYAIVTGILDMTAGQYVELFAYQSSGGALNVIGADPYSPWFQIEEVR